MNVAIVGCGNIANTHAKALKQLGQSLFIVVDNNINCAKSFQTTWGATKASNQLTDALVAEVDSVHLCTPPTLHYEMAKQILQAGKNLICEKPLCLESAQAKELYELSQAKGLIAAVNFNIRYHEACQRAKAVIGTSDFGEINLIHGSYMQEFHVLPADYMWRYLPEVGGKMRAVTEIGSHWIDLVRFWTGLEIKEVSANFGKFNPNRLLKDNLMYTTDSGEKGKPVTVDSEDVAIVSLRFANGAIGSLLLSEVSHGRSNSVNLEVTSGKKSVWWSSEDPYRLNTAQHKFQGVNTSVNAFGGGFPDTFANFFGEVYQALEKGEATNYPTFYDGYINAAICEAVYNSANNNSIWTEVT